RPMGDADCSGWRGKGGPEQTRNPSLNEGSLPVILTVPACAISPSVTLAAAASRSARGICGLVAIHRRDKISIASIEGVDHDRCHQLGSASCSDRRYRYGQFLSGGPPPTARAVGGQLRDRLIGTIAWRQSV